MSFKKQSLPRVFTLFLQLTNLYFTNYTSNKVYILILIINISLSKNLLLDQEFGISPDAPSLPCSLLLLVRCRVIIAVCAWYCGLLESAVWHSTADFSSLGFPQGLPHPQLLVEEPALEAQCSFLSGYFPLAFPSTRQPQGSGTIYPQLGACSWTSGQIHTTHSRPHFASINQLTHLRVTVI